MKMLLTPFSAVANNPPAPNRTHVLPVFCSSVAASLLFFLVFAQAGVLLSFSAGFRVSPFVAPTALLLGLALGDLLGRRAGLRDRTRLAVPATAFVVVIVALRLAASFYDMSWDGLWYHQTAVYQMSHGWNPLRDPMHAFDPQLQTWVRYYAKGPWYVALALFQTTHHIEWAKAAPWIVLVATFLMVFSVALDFGLRRLAAAMLAALVALNPVTVCQLASYLVDGLMISFLACFVAATLRGFQRPTALTTWVAIVSAVLCIGSKQTGLVYLCFFIAAGGLFVLVRRRDLLARYVLLQFGTLALGVVIFGFNPYVTNTVNRGNPFYPWSGSAAHPSFSQRGRDPNELYETPKNMVGRSRFFRLGYALFGRPGAQPFFEGDNARLMTPFAVHWRDFEIFYFHEVRIAGFGPLFSGGFLLGLVLLGAALARPTGLPREIPLLLSGAVIASLLIGVHTWWARYGPQLWWLPLIALVAAYAVPRGRVVRTVAWSLAALLLVNTTLIAFTHFRWELAATRVTREQLVRLRQQPEVEVDLQYFGEPFGERLRTADVHFRPVRNLSCGHPVELMSVAPGYPGAIHACVADPAGFPLPPVPLK